MEIVSQSFGRVRLITLNRPRVLNAVNQALLEELCRAWEEFLADPDQRVLVVTGAGEKAFCVGADLKEWRAAGRDFHAAGVFDRLVTPMRRLDCFKPTIAALNGLCLAGGLELALVCDLRLAAATASLGLPEIRRGVFPGQGATQRLARLLPYNLAAELLFTGEPITAQEAWRLGLVNRLVEPGDLLDQALALARRLAEGPPLALAAAKQALLAGYDLPLAEGLALEARLRKEIAATRDAREGVAAFVERRPPVFRGD